MEATLKYMWNKFRNDVLKEKDDSAEEIQFMRKIFYTGASCLYACEGEATRGSTMEEQIENVRSLHRELDVFKVEMAIEAMMKNSVPGDGDLS